MSKQRTPRPNNFAKKLKIDALLVNPQESVIDSKNWDKKVKKESKKAIQIYCTCTLLGKKVVDKFVYLITKIKRQAATQFNSI